MILLLDTSTSTCKLTLVDGKTITHYDWQADRTLAKGLLKYIVDTLAENKTTIQQLNGLGVMKGPGSFTGLRIGCTVLNTIAEFEHIPIVGTTGEQWQAEAQGLLHSGVNQRIVLPDYGREARITKPRK